MKTKPILITIGIIVLGVCVFLFVRSRGISRPGKIEVSQFLVQFEENLAAGNTDSVKHCFEIDPNGKVVTRLVNILSDKNPSDGKPNLLFKLNMDAAEAKIIYLNADLVQASIPIQFNSGKLPTLPSLLILKIHKLSANQLKIVQVDVRRFLADYAAYKKKIEALTVPESAMFDPVTLAAFKVAKQLKPKYDSVLYFQHIGNQTFYYVARGHFRTYNSEGHLVDTDSYKVGLVNPEMKEIIPVEYSLIHNIGGTFDGLIEVEKDGKKGYIDTTGKVIVPANYEQAIPLTDDANLGLLKNGDDYFYLKKDLSISEKLVDFKIRDVLKKIKDISGTYTISAKEIRNIMEYNSKDDDASLIFPPAYLVEWDILPKQMDMPNPIRKKPHNEEEEDGAGIDYSTISFDGYKPDEKNWFEAMYYSVVSDYIGGRGGLYGTKNLLFVDNKKNRISGLSIDNYYGDEEGGGVLSGKCNDNYLRQINDTLYEFKTTVSIGLLLNGISVDEAPHYQYLHLVNSTLKPLPTERLFGFTKFVKMDDSYLYGCYIFDQKQADKLTPELLQYMKNEIFASYHFKFKTAKWTKEFEYRFEAKNESVDDSLTAIDKYNINWISQKLKAKTGDALAAR